MDDASVVSIVRNMVTASPYLIPIGGVVEEEGPGAGESLAPVCGERLVGPSLSHLGPGLPASVPLGDRFDATFLKRMQARRYGVPSPSDGRRTPGGAAEAGDVVDGEELEGRQSEVVQPAHRLGAGHAVEDAAGGSSGDRGASYYLRGSSSRNAAADGGANASAVADEGEESVGLDRGRSYLLAAYVGGSSLEEPEFSAGYTDESEMEPARERRRAAVELLSSGSL